MKSIAVSLTSLIQLWKTIYYKHNRLLPQIRSTTTSASAMFDRNNFTSHKHLYVLKLLQTSSCLIYLHKILSAFIIVLLACLMLLVFFPENSSGFYYIRSLNRICDYNTHNALKPQLVGHLLSVCTICRLCARAIVTQ